MTKPRDVAALSLALIAASVAGVLADLSYLWLPQVEPIVLVVVTVFFGLALRYAFMRAEGRPRWFLGGAIGLASTVAGAASFVVLGVTCGLVPGETLEALVLGGEIGLALGLGLVPAALGLRADWQRPLVDAFDRVLLTCAVLVAVVAGLAVSFEAEWLKSYCGSIVLGIATILFVIVGMKTWTRGRWLHAVIAGKVPGWSIIERFDGDAQLPAIGDPLADPVVLATGNAASGPFRGGNSVVPVARIDRARGYGRRAIIAFVCAAATLVGTPLSLARRRTVLRQQPFSFPATPQRFAGLGPTDDIAVGTDAVCVHQAGGRFQCWGDAVDDLVGVKGEGSLRTPTEASKLTGEKVWLGQGQACMLQPASTECFNATASVRNERAADVAFGRGFRLLLGEDGRVTRYDANGHAPLDVPIASAIAVRDRLGCVLTRDGAVYCFGRTATSELAPLHEVGGFAGQRVDRIGIRNGEAWAAVVGGEDGKRWYAWNGGDAVWLPQWDGIEEIVGDLSTVCGRRPTGAVICADGATAVPQWLPGAPGSPKEVLPAGSALQLAASSNVICARGDTDVWCWGGIP